MSSCDHALSDGIRRSRATSTLTISRHSPRFGAVSDSEITLVRFDDEWFGFVSWTGSLVVNASTLYDFATLSSRRQTCSSCKSWHSRWDSSRCVALTARSASGGFSVRCAHAAPALHRGYVLRSSRCPALACRQCASRKAGPPPYWFRTHRGS